MVRCMVAWLMLATSSAWGQELQRSLPGYQDDGTVKLPNQWSIKPAGTQIALGDFPVNASLHPSGQYLAVLHAGYGEHEIVILSLEKKVKVVSRVTIPQTFVGLCFSPSGMHLFASGGEFDVIHQYDFAAGFLHQHRKLALDTEKFIPAGMTTDPKGEWLCVAGTWGDALALISVSDPAKILFVPFGKDAHPYTCVIDAEGKHAFVSLWNKASIAVVSLAEKRVVRELPTEKHPTEMVFTPDGKHLFVACANSTQVSVVEVATGKAVETIACALYPNAPSGNTPNSVTLTPDGQLLFVANADANNISVFNVSKPGRSQPLGFIPTGIYPTAVRYHADSKRLLIVNGRGDITKANPNGPNPIRKKAATTREYIAGLYQGTLSVLDVPNEHSMIEYTKQAYTCSPLRPDFGVVGPAPADNPIPAKLGLPSPIKYCIYVIRENRTYDQVFGDIPGANGDPRLCIFPEKITPNAHRLAKQFVLLDNFYCEGEVSAEGHEWSMGAYCTDFVKKVWPLTYRGSPTKKLNIYPSEGSRDDIARPAGGYIWDRAAEAKVSYRSYGEWIQNGKTLKDPGIATVKALEGHFDPWFRGYDLDYPDVKRSERFLAELKRFEQEGDMPRLQIVRLPNDHTYGSRAGKPTPTAMVAENDYALGLFIEGITKCKFWKETAVFIVEDDAQNGSDHVDAHRTVALVVSPYTQTGKVDSTMYSTSSMLRSMELILGLQPMSQFDAAARPMYASFSKQPKFEGYQHVVPNVDMTELNAKTAWGAKLSEQMDLSREDAADDLLFNEVIWRSVRGPNSPMPAPVRSAFVFPRLK